MKYFSVQDNALENLYIKNGNNTNVSFFRTYGNPDLYCIEVDNSAYSTANWTDVSGQVNFSEDCALKLAPKVFLQGAASNPIVGEELLMRDDLRTTNYMPLTSPFRDAVTCDASVLTTIGNDAIVDWVWVELRDAMDDTITIIGQSALLQRDGDVVGLDGVSPLGFRSLHTDYHVMIKHQSHLGIVSSTTMHLDQVVTNLDMMTASSTVKGGGNAVAVLPNGLYAMYCGDFDNNGQVQNTDVSSVRLLIGGSGYSKADMDMNGQIQNTDINNIINPNIGKGEQF